jgi:NAD(P)-dependent dehydrogenase (short-subunit alcohol dehydrogenase family)
MKHDQHDIPARESMTSPSSTAQTHTGQRVLITAAASGIGRVVANAFVDAGAKVFICDVDRSALDQTLRDQPGIAGMICDVADEEQVNALFATALPHLGGLDILVNNAGIAGPTAGVEEISLADWRRCLAVNLDASFLCARAAVPHLKRQQSGSIVNMSSNAGLFGFPRRSPYASAKWAIRGLTRTLAQELGPSGIRVNCICPGSVAGERIDRVIASDAAKTNRSQGQVRDDFIDQSSLKTFIQPDDIAAIILFLTSAAGARISGQDIAVDGHTETL